MKKKIAELKKQRLKLEKNWIQLNGMCKNWIQLNGMYQKCQKEDTHDSRAEADGLEMNISNLEFAIDMISEEIRDLQVSIDIKELSPKVRKLEKRVFKN